MGMVPRARLICTTALLGAIVTAPAGCDRAETEQASAPAAPAPQSVAPPGPVASPPPAPAASGPHISFAAREHDFGSVRDTKQYSFAFPFTNDGDRPLEILDVKSNCGCATASLERTTYRPGEGSVIEVTYRPSGTGPQQKQIRVLSNSKPTPVAVLTISADVTAALVFDPPAIARHDLRLGREHKEIFRVWSRDPEMIVTAVSSRNPLFSLRLLGSADPISEGCSPVYQVEVTVSSRARWGSHNALLAVTAEGRFGDDDAVIEHTASIPFNASVYGELLPSQSRFVLAIVTPGDSFRKVIRLTRREGAPFTIRNAEVRNSTLPGVTVKVVKDMRVEGSAYGLILRGDTGDYLGPIRGHVVIETDVPGEERRIFQFGGVVREPSP